jgi:glycosyltransferase involved in cell wall biosynthesis
MQALVPSIDGFLIHSQDYAARMGQLLHLPESKIHIVPLGIDVSAFRSSEPATTQSPFSIGYLARMAPEKGLHRIVDAFIAIAHEPDAAHATLKLAGWMGPQHEQYWLEQKNKLDRAGLSDRWEYVGSIDRTNKAAFLSSLDLFCVPTTYTEPKGLFLLEAIAAGVPYLQPNHGAFPEIHDRIRLINPSLNSGALFQWDSEEDLRSKLLSSIRNRQAKRVSDPAVWDEIDIATHAKRVLAIFDK